MNDSRQDAKIAKGNGAFAPLRLCAILLLLWCSFSHAQRLSDPGFLASLPAGAMGAPASETYRLLSLTTTNDWANASGVLGGPTHRTTVYTNLTSSATASEINAAIAACPSNQVVYCGPGTYNLGASIVIAKSGVTLRGASNNTTIFRFTAVDRQAGVYIGDNEPSDSYITNTATDSITNLVTSTLVRGSTNATLASVAGLAVGRLIAFDELEDFIDLAVTGSPDGCGTCARLAGKRGHHQIVKVTGISGTDITFTPPIRGTNWSAANTPCAYWHNGAHTERSSLEHIQITNATASVYQYGVHMKHAANCWTFKVEEHNATTAGFFFRWASRCVFLSSKAVGSDGGAGSYALSGILYSDCRIEDCISQESGPAFVQGGASSGNVIFACYQTNAYYTGSSGAWAVQSMGSHGHHTEYLLVEACHAQNLYMDYIRGSGAACTLFRNRAPGRIYNSFADQITSQNTTPVVIQTTNRYFNVIGNVLGDDDLHDNYQVTDTLDGDGDKSIFVLGKNSSAGGLDTRVTNTLTRKYNFDVVTATNSGIVLGDHNGMATAGQVPASLLYTSKPTLHYDGSVYWGSLPWPAFDPATPGNTTTNSTTMTNIPAGHIELVGAVPP